MGKNFDQVFGSGTKATVSVPHDPLLDSVPGIVVFSCFLCGPAVWKALQVLDLKGRKWCGRENYCRSGRKELDLCCVVAPDRPGLVRQSTRAQCSNLAELSNSWSAANHWEHRPGRRLRKAWNFRIKIRNNTNLLLSFTQKKSSD